MEHPVFQMDTIASLQVLIIPLSECGRPTGHRGAEQGDWPPAGRFLYLDRGDALLRREQLHHPHEGVLPRLRVPVQPQELPLRHAGKKDGKTSGLGSILDTVSKDTEHLICI